MSTYSGRLLLGLALGLLAAMPSVGEDRAVEEVMSNHVTFEPVYAVPVENGAYLHASPSPELDLTIDAMRALTPEQINEALGVSDGRLTGAVTPADRQLGLIEVRATREQFGPVHTTIPLGLASIAWAIRNPSEAWRIVFPVLG